MRPTRPMRPPLAVSLATNGGYERPSRKPRCARLRPMRPPDAPARAVSSLPRIRTSAKMPRKTQAPNLGGTKSGALSALAAGRGGAHSGSSDQEGWPAVPAEERETLQSLSVSSTLPGETT